jgi:hypothetical protein
MPHPKYLTCGTYSIPYLILINLNYFTVSDNWLIKWIYYNHTNSPSVSFQYNHNPSVHGQQLSAKLPKNFIHIIQNVYVHNQDTSPFTLTYAFHYNSLSYFLQASINFHPSTTQGLTSSLSLHNITNGNTLFCFPGCQTYFLTEGTNLSQYFYFTSPVTYNTKFDNIIILYTM